MDTQTSTTKPPSPPTPSRTSYKKKILYGFVVLLVLGVVYAYYHAPDFLGILAGTIHTYFTRKTSCKTISKVGADFIPDILFPYNAVLPNNLSSVELKQREEDLNVKREKYDWSDEGGLFPGFPPFLKDWNKVSCEEDFGATDLYVFKSEQVKSVFEAQNHKWKKCDQLQDYMTFYAHTEWFPKPHVADYWNLDEEFSRQRLAGVNPVVIESIDKIPSNFNIDKDKINELVSPDNLDNLLKEGKVFLEAYDILDHLTVASGTVLAAPYILHYVNSKDKLSPLAIQLFPEANRTSLGTFYPDEREEWMFAKIVAQNALAIHHQVVTHLLKTHLFAEVFAIATHRTLHTEHPIFVLLQHHFARTLFINHEALDFLVPTVIKYTASTGVEGSAQLGARAWKQANFTDLNLRNNLIRRGVMSSDKLQEYDYRDFGLAIWDAIHRYAYNVIVSFYSTNEMIKNDIELQAWANEIATNGKFPEFPKKIETITQLAEVIATIIWTSTGQHAAVNFNQYEMLSFVPNMPLALEMSHWPKSRKEIHLKSIESMLPCCSRSWNQVNSVKVLSKLPTWPWQRLDWPVKFADDKANSARAHLIDEFNVIKLDFDGKNANRPEHLKYTVLYPSDIPLSVGI